MNLGRVVGEIQRRHVGRVAGFYAVAGWVILQVVATVFPLLGISDVAAKVVLVLIAIGFPVTIVLAWVFDVTPGGWHRTEALPEAVTMPLPGRRDFARGMGLFGVGILVALGAFAALSRVREDRDAKTAAGIRSIAVLPFVDMSQQQDQSYFTDGIAEELLNRLAKIPDLKVPARTASFAYRGTTMSVADIARRLNVEALLEGSVRRDGDNVRVTVRLIDARTQNELWTNEYTKQISSVFAIQDEIATDIVDALRLQIDPQSSVAGGDASVIDADPATVEAYMKGLELWNRRTDRTLRNAITYFEGAVSKDEEFALGYAMLAQVYAVLPAYGDFPAFEASSKGQVAAARALQLNPNQAEAYAALGQIRQNFEWDFESAERSYKRAILFNNGYATAHQWRAEALLFLGRYDESRAEIDNALNLDPSSAAAQHVKAYQHITRREFAAANRILDRLLATHADYPLALISKATVAIMTQQAPAVSSSVQRLSGSNQGFAAALSAVAAAAADPAKKREAEAALAQLQGRAASELALWYALAGLEEKALATIKAAYESGADANLPFVLLHPAFDAIRPQPDYQSILKELHMAAA